MFMFYFQPDYARIKRDDWLECFEQCQAAAIFENQILPSEGRTDICWEMQKCEYLDGLTRLLRTPRKARSETSHWTTIHYMAQDELLRTAD